MNDSQESIDNYKTNRTVWPHIHFNHQQIGFRTIYAKLIERKGIALSDHRIGLIL